MGLDMYLYKEKYYGTHIGEGKRPDVEGFEDCKSISVRGEAIYWRKANAIHHWFVENVQCGRDECQDSYVEIEQLKTLLGDVEAVSKDHNKAESILPTSSGFFFGSTEYDDYYFGDIEKTKRELKDLLDSPDVGKYDYYYHSSW